MPLRYRHLFFDLDHTLWDFEANSHITLLHLYESYELASKGIAEFKDFLTRYTHHNDVMWERFRNGFIKREELRWKRIWHTLLDFKIYNSEMAHEMSATYLELLPTQTLLFPDARETLAYCAERGYRLHLITNGFEVTQRQKIQHSGIAAYFDEMITSERSMSMKPHAGIFEYALRATGATTQESLMIGDALEIDILGAQRAGWDTVYFNPLGKPHQERPTYEIKHLIELQELL